MTTTPFAGGCDDRPRLHYAHQFIPYSALFRAILDCRCGRHRCSLWLCFCCHFYCSREVRDRELGRRIRRQRRVSEILGDNIKIEVISKRETADKILTVLQQDFFPRYAVIACMSEVQVLREDKYT